MMTLRGVYRNLQPSGALACAGRAANWGCIRRGLKLSNPKLVQGKAMVVYATGHRGAIHATGLCERARGRHQRQPFRFQVSPCAWLEGCGEKFVAAFRLRESAKRSKELAEDMSTALGDRVLGIRVGLVRPCRRSIGVGRDGGSAWAAGEAVVGAPILAQALTWSSEAREPLMEKGRFARTVRAHSSSGA